MYVCMYVCMYTYIYIYIYIYIYCNHASISLGGGLGAGQEARVEKRVGRGRQLVAAGRECWDQMQILMRHYTGVCEKTLLQKIITLET